MKKRVKRLSSLLLAFSLLMGQLPAMAATGQQTEEAGDQQAEAVEADAPGPQMGWSSWNYFNANITEENIKEIAQAMVDSGLNEYGYEYVNLDDCWMDLERDSEGKLQWNTTTFPNGAEIVQEINAMDSEHPLKVGLYSAASAVTCQSYPASYWNEETDARSFAEWGVEYLKYDYCHVDLATDFLTEAPDIDSITVNGTTYQAEEATLEGNASKLDGYVTGLNQGGGSVTFQNVSVPSEGTYTMTVAYKTYPTTNNKGRYIQAVVNGADEEFQDAFIPSVDVETITTCEIKVPLKEGTNTIKLHNPVDGHQADSARRYQKMANALKKATAEVAAENGVEEKPIFYSVADSGVGQAWNWATDFAGSWRTGHDIVPYWEESDVPSSVTWSHTTVMSAYDTAVELWEYQKPGAYNDPDMLQVGNGDLTEEENKSHFTLWCMLSAPLILGNDLRQFVIKDADGNVTIDHEACNGAYDIVTNEEMIRIDQEGLQCKRVYHSSDLDILVKPLTDGEIAVCFLNRGKDTISASYDLHNVAEDDTRASLPVAAAYQAVDLWAEGSQDNITGHILESGEIPSHGVKVYRVSTATVDKEARLVLGSVKQMRLMQECTIEAYVENLGSTAMEQIEVTLELPEGFRISGNSDNENSLAGGETALYSWKVVPISEAAGGTLKVSLSYQFAGDSEVQQKEVSKAVTVSTEKLPDEMFLSEMEWVSSTNGDGEIRRNLSHDGNALRVGDNTYENGVGVHAVSEICVDLGGGSYRFTALAGLDRESVDSVRNYSAYNNTCSVTFELWADGVEIYNSGTRKYNEGDGDDYSNTMVDIDVTIQNCHQLVLKVGNADGSISDDHADWVNAKFTKLYSYWEKDELYLSEMDWVSSENGDGEIRRNLSHDGNKLKVGTETYENGVGVHANSVICVDLGGDDYRFTAVAGLDREAVDAIYKAGLSDTTHCSVTFELWADGVQIYDSGKLKYNASDGDNYSNTMVDIDVTIENCHQLELRVGDADGYIWEDHADWANAKFTRIIPERPVDTEVLGDANGDGKLDVADVVRVKVDVSCGKRLAAEAALFANWEKATEEDAAVIRKLLVQTEGGVVTAKVMGADSSPGITVKDGAGDTVYNAEGSFVTILPAGSYSVTAESETAVAKTETFAISNGTATKVTVNMMSMLEPATYIHQYDGYTAEFVFESDTVLYKGTEGMFSSGVLKAPADVKAVNEWVLEADVQIKSDTMWPSVGLALYNGGNYADNVKFEIVRTTPDTGSGQWQLRVNGTDYWPGMGNSIGQWLTDNQAALQDKVHMTVVYKNGNCYMFLNGECVVTSDALTSKTEGWESIRPGFYAEQNATFENWNYSTQAEDIAKYLGGEYEVTGKIAAEGTVDLSDVQVTVADENGNTVETLSLSESGDFTVTLAAGIYYVSAKSSSLMSDVQKVFVAGANKSLEELILSKPIIQVKTGEYTYDEKTGYYTTSSNADNRAYMGTVAQNTPFVLEAEIKDMATADDPNVGFRIETNPATESYLYFNLRYDTNAGVYQYWLKRWAWDKYGNIERLTTFEEGSWLRNTPFKDGTLKMALVYKEGYYYAYFNGELTFTISETEALTEGTIQAAIGDGDRSLNLFAGRKVTFVDWSYSTDISEYQQ